MPRIPAWYAMLPYLTNKEVATICLHENFDLILGVEHDTYIYCMKLRIALYTLTSQYTHTHTHTQ
jgi:hypothetical protein